MKDQSFEPDCAMTIQNRGLVASYNLLEAAKGSIAVPGSWALASRQRFVTLLIG